MPGMVEREWSARFERPASVVAVYSCTRTQYNPSKECCRSCRATHAATFTITSLRPSPIIQLQPVEKVTPLLVPCATLCSGYSCTDRIWLCAPVKVRRRNSLGEGPERWTQKELLGLPPLCGRPKPLEAGARTLGAWVWGRLTWSPKLSPRLHAPNKLL